MVGTRPQPPRAASRPGVQLLDVSRRADAYAGVQRVRLSVAPGTVCALSGSRGEVDTLMGLLSTRLAPHEGHVLLDGHDTMTATRAARASLGYVGPTSLDWGALTVAEALDLSARAHAPGHRVDRAHRRRIGDLTMALGLPGRSRTWCADLDAPRARRLAIACALVHAPQVLLLHDPLTGLDPAERDDVADLCRHLTSRGLTIVLGAATEPIEEDTDIRFDTAFASAVGTAVGPSVRPGHDGSDEDRIEGMTVRADLEGLADRVLLLQDGLLVAGRELSGEVRPRRWRVVSWDGRALVAGLDRLGVDHDLIAGGHDLVTEPDLGEHQADHFVETADGRIAFAGFDARRRDADPSDEADPPEQTVVEVAIAQDADAASLLAALVAAGVPVHGFLPPATPERGPALARPQALTVGPAPQGDPT